jgi:Family of unknown function (DUF5678)
VGTRRRHAVTFELIAEVPESREVTLRLPPEVPVGRVRVSVSPSSEPEPIRIYLGDDGRPRAFPKRPTHPKLATEHDAFEKMLPQLMTEHAGKYVGIHDGRVVAVGGDRVDVLTALHRSMQGVMVLIRLVTDQPQPLERLPVFREVRVD